MAAVRIVPATGQGVYAVLVDGEKVGEVQKRADYYNLHPRPATYISWLAYRVDGVRLDDIKYERRRDAVDALLAAQS